MPIPPPESRENDVGAAVTPAPTVAPRGVFRRRKQDRDEAILLVRCRLATSSDADGPGLAVGTVSEPCELARGLVADGRAGNARPRRRCPPARVRVRVRRASLRLELLLDHAARAVDVRRRHTKGHIAPDMPQRDMCLEGARAGPREGRLAKGCAPSV